MKSADISVNFAKTFKSLEYANKGGQKFPGRSIYTELPEKE